MGNRWLDTFTEPQRKVVSLARENNGMAYSEFVKASVCAVLVRKGVLEGTEHGWKLTRAGIIVAEILEKETGDADGERSDHGN